MEKMWNLVISFPGNLAFGGKTFAILRRNICNFEAKFMYILVCYFQKLLKICKKTITFLMQFLTIFQGNFAFFSSLA